jgi:hypothetical protein
MLAVDVNVRQDVIEGEVYASLTDTVRSPR